MLMRSFSIRLSRYGLVGVGAAGIHALALLVLGRVMPLWVANPLAFLAASFASYLGHACFTFRAETGGQRFARRWLILQYVVNLTVSSVLPLALPQELPDVAEVGLLVFTPTVLNALIWSRAARFSQRRRSEATTAPRRHADDLGLSQATNQAILKLAADGLLQGTSLLVNGPAATEGANAWRQLAATRSNLELCLHLCLTEGPSSAPPQLIPDLVNSRGHLQRTFGWWLLLSLLPQRHPRRRRLTHQLGVEIDAQIERFQHLRGPGPIALDGHQHIHLVPVVLEAVLSRAERSEITWLRSTDEPLPTGLPLLCWWQAWRQAGVLKWLILRQLSRRARPAFQQHGIQTNGGFAGVLFTGQMVGAPLQGAWRELSSLPSSHNKTPPVLLAHPSAPLDQDLGDAGFTVSQPFAASDWRQREWRALEALGVNPDGRSG